MEAGNILEVYNEYLNEEFVFSKSFVNFILNENVEYLEPWFIFCIDGKYTAPWCKKLKELYPDRSLIPFAGYRCTDDIACFDGNDKTGNPKVLYIHAFSSPGWELRGEADSFDEWLKQAAEDAKKFKEESDD